MPSWHAHRTSSVAASGVSLTFATCVGIFRKGLCKCKVRKNATVAFTQNKVL